MSQPEPTTPDRSDALSHLVDELDDRAREEAGDPLGKAAAGADEPSEAADAEPPS